MRNKILIIGASSKVAQSISETLINNDYELIGTYNNEYPQNPECYGNLIKIDFLIRRELNKLKNLDYISDIIFTIGKTEFLDKEKSKINFISLSNLLNFIREIKENIRIIFCSSTAVYGGNESKIISEDSEKMPSNIYGKQKLMAEEILKESKNKFVIIRFPIIFGSYFTEKFNRFIDAIKEDRAVIFGNGKNKFSFIHQSDLADFFLKIIEHNEICNEDFNISSGYVLQRDYVKSVANLFGKKSRRVVPLNRLYDLADEQLKKYQINGIKPSLLKEDLTSLSRDRVYNIRKALKIVGWKPKINIDRAIKDTFTENRLFSRWDGINILNYLYPKNTLPVKIYRDPNSFDPKHFKKKANEIWSVTIRDEEGDLINTDHLFSRNHENIKNFMIKNKKPNKVYIVRLSPIKDKIQYYGSFLIDRNNFGDKVIITISKRPEEPFISRGQGKSFKILPRDFVPDYNLTYEKNKLNGHFTNEYSNKLVKDINKMLDFLKKTKRQDLTIPVLFIITERKIEYISLGL